MERPRNHTEAFQMHHPRGEPVLLGTPPGPPIIPLSQAKQNRPPALTDGVITCPLGTRYQLPYSGLPRTVLETYLQPL